MISFLGAVTSTLMLLSSHSKSAALSCCAAQYHRRALKRFSSIIPTAATLPSLPSGTPLCKLLEIDWWLTQRATAATDIISRAVV